ncbi:MAG: ABC transporter ATP-binding protein [Saprospiraceae bacterium]|nr:ABC transporter ATP-binding protein [Saprospiraceae bacterium]
MSKYNEVLSKFTRIEGVQLKVKEGDLVSILGASGAGKSTLLNIIGTLDKADSGTLSLFGQNTADMNAKQLAALRNKEIGFIFQFHHLLPEFTALENVSLPAYIASRKLSDIHEDATNLLDKLGLKERLHHKPGELSGGEQQRVALARAIINKPKILLADEPTGNLDHENASQVLDLILSLKNEYGMTTLIVTHDKDVAALADYNIMMKDGLISEHC